MHTSLTISCLEGVGFVYVRACAPVLLPTLLSLDRNAAFDPLHCIEFGPPKIFSKTFKFSIIFYSTLEISGGANFEKHADPEKKNQNRRKSRANSRNLQELFLRSRKEENLYGHCAMNNARRFLSKGSTL